MKTAKIFRAMQALVDQHVEHYKNDFETDKVIIKNRPKEVLYYWYLKSCGTFIAPASEIQWIETEKAKEAEFWLPQAKVIYEVHMDTQELKSINKAQMEKVIKAAKPMPGLIKIDYLIHDMGNLIDASKAYDALYYLLKKYQFKHWKLQELANKGAGIVEILEALEVIKEHAINAERLANLAENGRFY